MTLGAFLERLYGRPCPECGGTIDGGSLRYEGWTWAHRSEHPQGGHHPFDVLEALGDDVEVVKEFVPTDVVETGDEADTISLLGEVTLRFTGD